MELKLTQKLWKIALSHADRSEFYLRPEFQKKLNWNEMFPVKYENYFLELGSGWGEVAIELAGKNPKTGFILMEKNVDRTKSTIREIQKNNLKNIRFLTVNFQWFLTELFNGEFFNSILLNFPDPWPKKKHHKHRTVNADFIDKINYLLIPGGKFLFATDHGPYGRATIRLFRNEKRFSYLKSEYTFQRDDFPISHFEAEKREEKKTIYYLERIKN